MTTSWRRFVHAKANERGRFVVVSGRYHLAPDDGQGQSLLDLLPTVANVEGKGALRTLEDVQRLLTERRQASPI